MEIINCMCNVVMALCALIATITFIYKAVDKRHYEPNVMQRIVNNARVEAGLEPNPVAWQPKSWWGIVRVVARKVFVRSARTNMSANPETN